MASKKKRGKKRGKNTENNLIQQLSFPQLIQKGETELSRQKPREAISVLKFAQKKHGASNEIDTLLFQAYFLRYNQLAEKQLVTEAETVKQNALKLITDFKAVSEENLLRFVSLCTDKEAFNAYRQYLDTNKRSSGAEEYLVDHLLKSRNFELMNCLEKSHPLQDDIPFIHKAIFAMDQGEWEEALAFLGPVSRTSPFSSVKLFCRAMVDFYNENDNQALRALNMIPERFFLANVVNDLKAVLSKKVPQEAKDKAILRLDESLWDGALGVENQIACLIREFDDGQLKQIGNRVSKISKAIYPQHPETAALYIFQVLGSQVLKDKMEVGKFKKMITGSMSAEQVDLVMTKIMFLQGDNPLSALGNYIRVYLDKEFSDPKEQLMARAQALFYVASHLYFNDKIQDIKYQKKAIDRYKTLLGIESDTPHSIWIDLITESIRLDPLYHPAYELLVKVSPLSRSDRQKMEACLITMLEHFPDDPFPCLELASFYYGHNAFRKAENILEEAMKRAPHDSRVIDKHRLALLISAEKNIGRSKFHLVEKDIAKARELNSKKAASLVIEKQMLVRLLRAEKIQIINKTASQNLLFGKSVELNTVLTEEMGGLALDEQLQILSFLIFDLKNRRISDKKPLLKELNKIAKEKIKGSPPLSSLDTVRLLTPLEPEYDPLLPAFKPIWFFTKLFKPILEWVKNTEIFILYEKILEPDLFRLVKTDIKKRLKKATGKEKLVFQFYVVTLQHLAGDRNDPDLFFDILDQTQDESILEELRRIARQLSKHAGGSLKTALETFQFEILDTPPGFPDFFGDYDDDDDDDDFPFPDIFDESEGMMDDFPVNAFLDMLDMLPRDFRADRNLSKKLTKDAESMVDDFGVRGESDQMIKEMRNLLKQTNRGDFQVIETMAGILERIGAKEFLSHEALVFLYGKAPRKKKK